MEILAKYTHSQAQTTPAGHQWAERGSVTPNTCKKAESVKRSPYQMLINHIQVPRMCCKETVRSKDRNKKKITHQTIS